MKFLCILLTLICGCSIQNSSFSFQTNPNCANPTNLIYFNNGFYITDGVGVYSAIGNSKSMLLKKSINIDFFIYGDNGYSLGIVDDHNSEIYFARFVDEIYGQNFMDRLLLKDSDGPIFRSQMYAFENLPDHIGGMFSAIGEIVVIEKSINPMVYSAKDGRSAWTPSEIKEFIKFSPVNRLSLNDVPVGCSFYGNRLAILGQSKKVYEWQRFPYSDWTMMFKDKPKVYDLSKYNKINCIAYAIDGLYIIADNQIIRVCAYNN